MKEWQQNLVVGITGLVIGIVMFLIVLLQIPIGYELSMRSGAWLMLFGMFFVGVGVGTLVSTHTIYKLEKKLA